MKTSTKGKIVKGVAVAIDVAAPLIATLTQFPIWIEKSAEATMSGFFLLLAFVCILPFLRQVRDFIRSPSVWAVWVILFISFTLLRNIIDQMLVVCFVGMISNLIGAGIYWVGKVLVGKEDKN